MYEAHIARGAAALDAYEGRNEVDVPWRDRVRARLDRFNMLRTEDCVLGLAFDLPGFSLFAYQDRLLQLGAPRATWVSWAEEHGFEAAEVPNLDDPYFPDERVVDWSRLTNEWRAYLTDAVVDEEG